MAPVTNGRLLFNEVPTGFPEPGRHTVYDESQTIDLDNAPLKGGFLLKTLVLSIDPYLRGRMRLSEKNYKNPFTIGEPLTNFGVGVVLRSDHPAVKAGDHLYGFYSFEQYTIRTDAEQFRILERKENLPWSAYVGVCGMPGETAYYAWKEYAKPQNAKTPTRELNDDLQDDVAFVTAASGPVGATVVQLAKADGLKVIASAGSDEKVAFVKSLGADVAFNYKTASTEKILEKEGPINIYWDNVGGATLQSAIENAATYARFIECGMISIYNSEPYGITNVQKIVTQELQIHGFIVTTLRDKYVEEFYSKFTDRVAQGEIKYVEYFVKGLENAGQGLLDVQTGKNFGKCVVVVAEE